jgi:hypothetical protein
MRELRIPTKKTNPIHNDVLENATFLLLDQPSGEAIFSRIKPRCINYIVVNKA